MQHFVGGIRNFPNTIKYFWLWNFFYPLYQSVFPVKCASDIILLKWDKHYTKLCLVCGADVTLLVIPTQMIRLSYWASVFLQLPAHQYYIKHRRRRENDKSFFSSFLYALCHPLHPSRINWNCSLKCEIMN